MVFYFYFLLTLSFDSIVTSYLRFEKKKIIKKKHRPGGATVSGRGRNGCRPSRRGSFSLPTAARGASPTFCSGPSARPSTRKGCPCESRSLAKSREFFSVCIVPFWKTHSLTFMPLLYTQLCQGQALVRVVYPRRAAPLRRPPRRQGPRGHPRSVS